ncbi:MAG: FtsX-like permease family protein [Methanobacterium sp. ERen5]|nr:MAG: FtsX-like permease family protein [Methanobacterium sp. ERen5]
MNIYRLSMKNLRRNKMRNFFAIVRISFGVLILLVLLSSGIGLNTFLKQANSFHVNDNVNNSDLIISTVTNQLNSILGVKSTTSIIGSKIDALINNAVYILDGLASIVFLVGILDIMNTMGFNLNERNREIGILKTMGFSEKELLISMSLESGLIGFFGGIGGVILGSIGISVVAMFIEIPISILIPLWLIPSVIVLTTVLASLLGLVPGWFASYRNIDEVIP